MDVWGNTSAEIQRMVSKIINWTLSADRAVPSNDDDDSDRLVRPFPWHTNIVHLVTIISFGTPVSFWLPNGENDGCRPKEQLGFLGERK